MPSATVQELELDGELSLFDSATGTAIALNRTARDVWALVDGECEIDELVAILARAYGTSPEAIGSEVRATLDALSEAGVLLPSP